MKSLLIFLLMIPLLAVAADQPLSDLSSIATQQRQIRDALLAGDAKYAALSPEAKTELLERQDTLLRRLEGKRTAAELSDSDRMESVNDLEWIRVALGGDANERLVCRMERRIGSNRATRTCYTAAQLAAARESAQNSLSRNGACAQLPGSHIRCTEKLPLGGRGGDRGIR